MKTALLSDADFRNDHQRTQPGDDVVGRAQKHGFLNGEPKPLGNTNGGLNCVHRPAPSPAPESAVALKAPIPASEFADFSKAPTPIESLTLARCEQSDHLCTELVRLRARVLEQRRRDATTFVAVEHRQAVDARTLRSQEHLDRTHGSTIQPCHVISRPSRSSGYQRTQSLERGTAKRSRQRADGGVW